ncbi:ABC transporter permease [Paenibacillus antri]|uniref:ABC transporter permease n=1 Tax=Paenibacillus antri TaxID=2582848 RepID=UPI001EE4E1DC|nr:ABC transporter permease subunit [Paenibacillus antri]
MSKEKRKRIRRNIPLYLMFIPVLLFFAVFKYGPMGGLIIAFKDFNLFDGVFGSPWVGFANFETVFSNPQTSQIIRNTLVLSLLKIVAGFPFPILIALMLNEVRRLTVKKIVQTAVFLPYFLNWVIVGGIVVTMFATDTGMVNRLLEMTFGVSYSFLYEQNTWVSIFLLSDVWKNAGFGAIIYLAALAAIDPALYEAAAMDGAGKFRQAWHISLPGIRSIMILIFILSMGSVMEVGFDHVWVLRNPVVSDIAQVISTYVYEFGLRGGYLGLSTAIGLFESLVGFMLVLMANWIAKRFGEEIW